MPPDFIITDHARKRARQRFGQRVADSLASILEDSEHIGDGIYHCGELIAVTKAGTGKARGHTVVVTVRPPRADERSR